MWGEGRVGIQGKGARTKERGDEGQGRDHGETGQGEKGEGRVSGCAVAAVTRSIAQAGHCARPLRL